MRTCVIVAMGLTLVGVALARQGSSAVSAAPPAVDKSAAEIKAALDAAGAVSKVGAAVTVHPGISVRRRSSGGEPQYAIVHPLSIEIYQVIAGSATLVTGGTLAVPLTDSADDLVRSTSIVGGESRKVAEGDVVVMPPGTPHWFSDVQGTITYLEARVRVNPSPKE